MVNAVMHKLEGGIKKERVGPSISDPHHPQLSYPILNFSGFQFAVVGLLEWLTTVQSSSYPPTLLSSAFYHPIFLFLFRLSIDWITSRRGCRRFLTQELHLRMRKLIVEIWAGGRCLAAFGRYPPIYIERATSVGSIQLCPKKRKFKEVVQPSKNSQVPEPSQKRKRQTLAFCTCTNIPLIKVPLITDLIGVRISSSYTCIIGLVNSPPVVWICWARESSSSGI